MVQVQHWQVGGSSAAINIPPCFFDDFLSSCLTSKKNKLLLANYNNTEDDQEKFHGVFIARTKLLEIEQDVRLRSLHCIIFMLLFITVTSLEQ